MQSNKSNGAMTAQISVSDHKKSGFDLSNNCLGTGKIGRIIPTRALHVMPGDTIKQDSKAVVQFEPLAVPILANMDVKQEHFYVPYNVVWRNWDKFISGGEKMDYNGVVPNVSMRDILENIVNIFNLFNILITPTNTGGENYLSFDASLNIARALQESVDNIAESYHIKDLLAPQYEVIKLLHDFDLTNEVYPNPYDFVLVSSASNTLEARERAFSNYLFDQSLTGNKYLEEIKPYVLETLQNNSIWLPTLQGFDKMVLFYEFVKPLCGLGSNIDFINMGRLTLSELILMQSLSITLDYTNHRLEPFADFTTSFNLGYSFANAQPLTILHLRANYNVWYNNYRDILLEADAFEPFDDDFVTTPELFTLLVPRQRCWEKDAFTTALDNPGTGSVGVPVGVANGYNNTNYEVKAQYVEGDHSYIMPDENNVYEVTYAGETWKVPSAFLKGVNPEDADSADAFAGFSLYSLDAAQRAQKWLQKALYFGNRISDFYYLRFGVRYLDARLRLPELLTSSSELVKLDVVMNNTPIPSENVIAGDRSAYASAYDNGNSFDRFCEEHGVILSYLTIMPQITYAYGMSRDYSRVDQFDFAFSEFATLGMDAVYDTEITASSFGYRDGNNSQVFGYQGKYYDYKAKHSEEHGELLDTQDMYTFSRKFNMFDPNGRPKLNYEFVHCFPSLDMFVVDSPFADYFRFDIRHSTAAERNLPSQSIYI